MTETTETLVQSDDLQPVEVILTDDGKGPQTETKIIPESEGIEDLKAQVKRAKEASALRLQEAEKAIREAHERAVKAEQETVETKRDVVSNVIDKLAMEKDAAKRDLKAAYESGNYDMVAEAQERLSLTAARIVEAEKGRLALDEEIKTPKQPLAQPIQQDPVHSIASQREKGGAHRSAAWIRAHPEFAAPGEMNEAMTKAHYYALSEGHAPETDGYFEVINQRLGLDGQGPAGRQQPAPKPAPRVPVSAPVSRDVTTSGRRGDPQRVTLSPNEVAAARAMGMSPQDYAKELVELAKEGKGRLAS
jgi:hypothetical protein